MKRSRHHLLTILSGLAFLPAVAQGVTAAWKIPANEILPDLKTNKAFHLLNQPPGDSPFFQPGDKLWDVAGMLHWEKRNDPGDEKKKATRLTGWSGDWIVWDARSQAVVASGSWEDLLEVDRFIQSHRKPRQVQAKFELVSGRDHATRTVTVTAKVGDTRTISSPTLSARCEGLGGREIDQCSFSVWWKIPDSKLSWQVGTRFDIKDRKRLLVAQFGDSGADDSWKLYLTAELETSDGTPVNEAVQVDWQGKLQPWPRSMDIDNTMSFPIDGARSVIYCVDSREGLLARECLPTTAPGDLSDWVRGSLLDYTKEFKELCPEGEDSVGPVAFFDPKTSTFIVVAKPELLDGAEILGGLVERLSWGVWVESNPEAGGWGVMVNSGTSASISRFRGKTEDLHFEIAPAMPGAIAELPFEMDWVVGGTSMGKVQSTVTLIDGQPLTVSKRQIKGDQASMILTAKRYYASE